MTAAELAKCEFLPTKMQVFAQLAGMLKSPPTKVALGVKAVPGKLAIAIKALADLDEDKTKTIGSFAKSA